MSRDTFARDEVIFRTSVNTYLHEAELCIGYDVGYPAVLLIDVILRFLATLKGQQVQEIISQLDEFSWFVSTERDGQKIAGLVCKMIDECKTIPAKQGRNPSRVIMARDRSRINRSLIPDFDILILDEFFLAIKGLALKEVVSYE